MAALTDLGLERSQQIISGGQFDHPIGLFYGGTGPTWSHRWLRDFVHQRLESVDRAAVIDLHTGLGPWSHAELISSEPAGSAALARQRSWWGQITSLNEGTSVSAEITGEWLAALSSFAPNTELTSVAIEDQHGGHRAGPRESARRCRVARNRQPDVTRRCCDSRTGTFCVHRR